MRTRLALAGLAGLAALGSIAASPAPSAGLCYDLDVVVNGEALVDEQMCLPGEDTPAPELPLPELP